MPGTITKRELALLIAADLPSMGISARQLIPIIDSYHDHIVDQIAKGNRIELRGIGVWEPYHMGERKARNPKTQEIVIVPAHDGLRFKCSRLVQERVNLWRQQSRQSTL